MSTRAKALVLTVTPLMHIEFIHQCIISANALHACIILYISTVRGVRSYTGCNSTKNNVRVLLSRILSIVISDWLQHARSVRVVYESLIKLRLILTLLIHSS